MEVHVQEEHHVHHNLHQRKAQNHHHRGGRAFQHITHHQPERNHGKDHRQHKAGGVFLQGNVGNVRIVMIMIVCMLAHGSTPIR